MMIWTVTDFPIPVTKEGHQSCKAEVGFFLANIETALPSRDSIGTFQYFQHRYTELHHLFT